MIMKTTCTADATELFQNFISHYKEYAITEPEEHYYHADIVAEAYKQGYSDGSVKGKEEFLKDLFNKHKADLLLKATTAYTYSKILIDYFLTLNCSPCSLYINVSTVTPSVFIAIPLDFMVDDEFLNKAYSKILDMANNYRTLFNNVLDIVLLPGEDLDTELLFSDGYTYNEDYCGK